MLGWVSAESGGRALNVVMTFPGAYKSGVSPFCSHCYWLVDGPASGQEQHRGMKDTEMEGDMVRFCTDDQCVSLQPRGEKTLGLARLSPSPLSSSSAGQSTARCCLGPHNNQVRAECGSRRG